MKEREEEICLENETTVETGETKVEAGKGKTQKEKRRKEPERGAIVKMRTTGETPEY